MLIHYMAFWMRIALIAVALLLCQRQAWSSGPRWTDASAEYRLLTEVPAADLAGRNSDEQPAEMAIDFAALLKEHGIDTDVVDMRSVHVVRYSAATDEPIAPAMSWAYGTVENEIPSRWLDAAIPYDFPEMEENLNVTEGKLVWTPRLRWGFFYDVAGNWKQGRLTWLHTQQSGDSSHYAIYFNTLPRGTTPWLAEPRGFIGDNLHRTSRHTIDDTTGLIHTRIDLVDWDGDGLTDIVAGCSRGGIIWYRNLGSRETPRFGSARMLFTEDGKPMDVGWTSSPKVVDWDNDGDLDIISGAEWNRVVLYENVGNDTNKRFVYRSLIKTADGKPLAVPFTPVPEGDMPDGTNSYNRDYYPILDVADWDGDGRMDLLAGGYVTGRVYFYRNISDDGHAPLLEYAGEVQADGQAIDVDWAAGPLAHDFTGDGLPELIVGNMKMTAGGGDAASAEYFLHYYRNIGTATAPAFKEEAFPRIGTFPKGALATPRAADINGDGLDDLIVSSGSRIYIYTNIGTATEPKFKAHSDPLPSEWGNESLSATQLLDWNGDGLLDQIIGYSVALNAGAGNPGVYGTAQSVLPAGQMIDHLSHKGDDWVWQRLFDIDGDGLLDALDGDHTGNIWYHRNIGTREAPSFDMNGQRLMQLNHQPIWVGPTEGDAAFDIIQGSRVTYTVADFNKDGKPDIVVGNYIGVVRYYQQVEAANGQLRFTEPIVIEDVKNRFVPFATDWDGDGRVDVIAAATAQRVMFIKNTGENEQGQVTFATGVWTDLPGAPYGAGGPILVADFNNDGDDDLIFQSAYGYTVWVERSFLGHGYAQAVVTGFERRPDAGADVSTKRLSPAGASAAGAYPAIVRLSDNRLMCVYSAWETEKSDHVRIVAVYSIDNGITWTEPVALIDSYPERDYDPSIVVFGNTIVVSSTTVPATHGEFISTSRTVAVRSTDNGATWSEPSDIPMGYRYTSGKINPGVYLQNGSAIFGYSWDMRIEAQGQIKSEGDEVVQVAFMESHDNGQTWQQGASLTADVKKHGHARDAISGLDEPAIVKCADGSLYLLARTGRDHLYESRSDDQGKTWSEPIPSALISHNAPAALCAIEGDRPGIVAVWNNSNSNRWPLSAAISLDNGKTWSKPRDIVATEGQQSSYPGCVQAADGEVVIVWQQDHASSARTIDTARISIDWLLNDGM